MKQLCDTIFIVSFALVVAMFIALAAPVLAAMVRFVSA